MNIVFVSTSFPHERLSNAGIFVYQLAATLAKAVSLTAIVPLPLPNQFASLSSLKIIPFAQQAWLHRVISYPGGLPAALKQKPHWLVLIKWIMLCLCLKTYWHARSAHLIHCNWALTGALVGLIGQWQQVPVITTLRGADCQHLDHWLQRIIFWLLFQTNYAIVCVSSDMKKTLAQRFPQYKSQLYFIPNGVHPAFAQRQCTRLQARKYLMINSLIPRKSVDTAIFALAQQHSEHPWQLSIAGSGAEQERLRRLCQQLAITDRVHFLGEVNHQQLVDIMTEHDIFLLTSLSEGRPNAVIEAMANGMPIIATQISGLKELVDHNNGYLVPPKQPEALAAQIKLLSQHSPSQIAALSQHSMQRIEQAQLTWPYCAQHYIQLYQAAVSHLSGTLRR